MQTDLVTRQKTSEQLQAMRSGGQILARILQEIRDYVHAGMSEKHVDAYVESRIYHYGAEVTYKTDDVKFPGAICISTNDELVHSPASERTFEKGDVVSYDLVITYDGMKVDSAFTMVIDDTPRGAVKHLLSTTERSLYAGIDAIKGPVRVGDISAAIEDVLAKGRLGIVRELVGHGVGFEIHMPPDVPNYGTKGTGILLRPGDTIAIEPMATLGKEKIKTLEDGWTISSADGSLAAHFEHTVLITETGAEILTQLA